MKMKIVFRRGPLTIVYDKDRQVDLSEWPEDQIIVNGEVFDTAEHGVFAGWSIIQVLEYMLKQEDRPLLQMSTGINQKIAHIYSLVKAGDKPAAREYYNNIRGYLKDHSAYKIVLESRLEDDPIWD